MIVGMGPVGHPRQVSIRAVVVDVGGVLERVDDASWPQILIDRWEKRAGRPTGHVLSALAEHAPGDTIATGRLDEQQIKALYADILGLDDASIAELMTEMWDAYCGELDVDMRDFVAGLRPSYKTAILSNSADGARREEQRRYDFDSLVDVIVYSHEVGLAKPDPAIYELTEKYLGVEPHEIVFIDDVDANITAATERGWRAVLHTSTGESIRQVRALLATHGAAGDRAASRPPGVLTARRAGQASASSEISSAAAITAAPLVMGATIHALSRKRSVASCICVAA